LAIDRIRGGHNGRVVDIAPAIEAQISACLEVRGSAFRDQAPTAYPAEQVVDLLVRDERPGMTEMIAEGQMFVAYVDGIVVGCAGWRGSNLYNLYVDPRFMRRGVGSALLRAVEAQYAAKSGRDIFCVDAGLYTRPFYVSQGYEVLREVTSSDGLAYLEMRKRLSRHG
jgi:ribosomal protein S18 acetylase RimI-like enzyme